MPLNRYNTDLMEDNVVSSRIRLARNVSDMPFLIKDIKSAEKLIVEVNKAVNRKERFTLYKMRELDEISRGAMVDRYLISRPLYSNTRSGAVLVSADENVAIMVNEEDQIREQCIMRGLKLKECFKRLSELDDELSKRLDFAFDGTLGYLTACPSNVGTGMRASVMMFLPALSESGQMKEAIEEARNKGMAVRGAYGEGSSAESFLYQISNEVTLGISEQDIIKGIEEVTATLSYAENATRRRLYMKKPLEIKDRCKRAFGVLTNCSLLSYEEFLRLISLVKLGITLGIFDFSDNTALDDMIINARSNCLKRTKGEDLTPVEESMFRAEYVYDCFKRITVR